jgi:hypothetical protein
MNVVNKHDHRPFLCCLHNFGYYDRKTLLVFPGHLTTSTDGSKIKLEQPGATKWHWYIPGNDSLSETLYNCCLANPWCAEEHWIIFGSAAEDMNESTEFIVPPDQGIKHPLSSFICDISAKTF